MRQPKKIQVLDRRDNAIMALKFSDKLSLLRHMKRWTIKEMAEKIGVSADRMEYLLAGRHEPKAADVIRIMNTLEVYFDPEDFESEGIPGKL
jgi:transcriptional regulator with XRE-family HTH domain